MKRYLLITLLVSIGLTSVSAEQMVFNATPDSRVDSSAEKSARQVLTESKRNEFRLLITKVGDQYFWTTRENAPLIHTLSGAFHIFTDASGGGYVKIFDTGILPQSMRDPGPRYQYMEHLHLGLGSITYWGFSDQFAP